MNTPPKPIGILAVDDHAIFRQGIVSLLTDQPDMKLLAQGASGPKQSSNSGCIALI